MYLLDWDNDELISFYYIGFGWWFGYQKKDTTRTSRSHVYAFGDNEWVHRSLVKDVTPLYCLSKSQFLARTKILSKLRNDEVGSICRTDENILLIRSKLFMKSAFKLRNYEIGVFKTTPVPPYS